MKQLKRERYRNMVKRINNLPNDKQMFVIGVINGMLISEETKNGAEVIEKVGQEGRYTYEKGKQSKRTDNGPSYRSNPG